MGEAWSARPRPSAGNALSISTPRPWGCSAVSRRPRTLDQPAWGPAWNDSGLMFTREDGSALRPEYGTLRFRARAQYAGLLFIPLHDYADGCVRPMCPGTSCSPGGAAWKLSA